MLQATNTPAISSPGTMPAMNRPPIEVSVVTPYSTIGPEGGIRMPSVPPAATRP